MAYMEALRARFGAAIPAPLLGQLDEAIEQRKQRGRRVSRRSLQNLKPSARRLERSNRVKMGIAISPALKAKAKRRGVNLSALVEKVLPQALKTWDGQPMPRSRPKVRTETKVSLSVDAAVEAEDAKSKGANLGVLIEPFLREELNA